MLISAGADYASNVVKRTWPDGLDCQVYTMAALEAVNEAVTDKMHRAHTGWNIMQNKDLYYCVNWIAPGIMHWPTLAVTLDTMEDMSLLRRIYYHFRLIKKNPNDFTAFDAIKLLREKPQLIVNSHIQRKEPGEG